MANYDLVIRGGEIHDGRGGPARSGDVAVKDGRIAAVGQVTGAGAEEIDAKGKIVTPGFVDVHTHYDGQCTWETRMAPSSNHGVTSVVMGNCGVGFAPCRLDDHDTLVKLMEGVEDIPEVVMTTGLPWTWQTFPEYLDVVAGRRLDIDVAAQLPHSALRVFVMGMRGARREPATDADLAEMRRLTTEALHAGAVGVTTSRNLIHRTRAGELAPSLNSAEDELLTLAAGLRDAGTGVFQLIGNIHGDQIEEFKLMRRLAEHARRPLSFTLLQLGMNGGKDWKACLRMLEEANAEGVEIRGQVLPRPTTVLYGLELSQHPFVLNPSFKPLLDKPLAEKVKAMRDPELRRRLLSEEPEDTNPIVIEQVTRFPRSYVMGDPPNYEPNIEDRIDKQAARLGVSVKEYAYDLLLRDDGHTVLMLPGGNFVDGNLDAAREMVGHPNTILGLGDGGAHYGMICDSSYPTSLLEKWVRDGKGDRKVDLPDAIRALSSATAGALGLRDRGQVAPGYKADLNVIDLDRLKLHAPRVVRDLPAQGRRLSQKADGYAATVVSGQITYRDGEPTGALPGRLVRGAQTAPA